MKPQPHSPAANGRKPEAQALPEPGTYSPPSAEPLPLGPEPANKSAQPWYPVFLATLAATGQVKAAAQAAGINNIRVYMYRKYDPWFAEQWRATLEQLQANPPAHLSGQRKPSAWRGIKPLRWPPIFLAALAATANVKQAAAKAGISTELAYVHRQHDADFAARWEEAIEAGVGVLEVEARRRAIEGERVYKFYQGQSLMHPERPDEPYYEVRYSDKLLIFLLKLHHPERHDAPYRPASAEAKAAAPEPQQRKMDLRLLSEEEQDTLELLLRKAAGEEEPKVVPRTGW